MTYINEIVLGSVVLLMAVMMIWQRRDHNGIHKDLLNRLTASLKVEAHKDYVQGEMRLDPKLKKKELNQEFVELNPDPKIFAKMQREIEEEEGLDVG